jgi:tetratricopeptide (TPR) repeat protein
MIKNSLRLLILFIVVAEIFPVYGLADKKTEPQDKPIFVISGTQKGMTPFPDDEGTRKIIRQTEIEREARHLEKQGRFDEAIAKYQEAMDPSLLNSERDKAGGMHGIIRIHQKEGKFDLALQELEWFSTYPNQLYIDTKPELEALIRARDTSSNEPIYAHIDDLKKRYKRALPPKGHESFVTSEIIRHYDYVGDLDAGIAFVEKILAYKKLYPKERDEYLKVKKALLEDKAQDTKGKATEVIVQSNYFSW